MREMPLVLVIEDDGVTARIIVNTLDRAGFRTLTAPAALPAFHMARERRPDVILLDLGLPGLGGAAAAVSLREEPELAGVPVILVSADPELGEMMRETGAVDALAKPFSPLELVHRVRRCTDALLSGNL